MMDRCKEFERWASAAVGGAEAEAWWREHLAGCASCREQQAADTLLRELPTPPVPELSAGFEGRLRRQLQEELAAERPAPASRPGGLRPAALWVLGVYGTAVVAASLLVLTHLPWQSIAAPPALGIALGGIALLSPVVLLDRFGVVRPPG